MKQVVLSAGLDDLRSSQMRLLHEASQIGNLHVLLWTDSTIKQIEGKEPKFPQEERKYFIESTRYVDQVSLVDLDSADTLPLEILDGGFTWVVEEAQRNTQKSAFCAEAGIQLETISDQQLAGFPEVCCSNERSLETGKPKVIVTGCYDWFHSGHVRFFEEVSVLGELHVVVGHDANIELLKGEGHPMYKQDERRYMAGSIRHVHQSYVSSGNGWLDAEPEIEQINPDIYAVNEDGDVAEKRDFCKAHGIQYYVLKRTPKEGLPKRQSTDLRGF